MIRVIVGKEFIEKYCYHARRPNIDGVYRLFPKDEIVPYWNYVVSYGTNSSPYEYKIGKMQDKHSYMLLSNTLVFDNDVLIFEFPEDYLEEALYFKLKYC